MPSVGALGARTLGVFGDQVRLFHGRELGVTGEKLVLPRGGLFFLKKLFLFFFLRGNFYFCVVCVFLVLVLYRVVWKLVFIFLSPGVFLLSYLSLTYHLLVL